MYSKSRYSGSSRSTYDCGVLSTRRVHALGRSGSASSSTAFRSPIRRTAGPSRSRRRRPASVNGNLGRVRESELAPGPLVERRTPESDYVRGGGPWLHLDDVA